MCKLHIVTELWLDDSRTERHELAKLKGMSKTVVGETQEVKSRRIELTGPKCAMLIQPSHSLSLCYFCINGSSSVWLYVCVDTHELLSLLIGTHVLNHHFNVTKYMNVHCSWAQYKRYTTDHNIHYWQQRLNWPTNYTQLISERGARGTLTLPVPVCGKQQINRNWNVIHWN